MHDTLSTFDSRFGREAALALTRWLESHILVLVYPLSHPLF